MTNTAFNTSLRFMLFTVILISLIFINESAFATTQKLEKFLDRDLGEVVGNGLLKFFDRNFWIAIGIGAVAGLLKANGDLRERVVLVGGGLLAVIVFYEFVIKGFLFAQGAA